MELIIRCATDMVSQHNSALAKLMKEILIKAAVSGAKAVRRHLRGK